MQPDLEVFCQDEWEPPSRIWGLIDSHFKRRGNLICLLVAIICFIIVLFCYSLQLNMNPMAFGPILASLQASPPPRSARLCIIALNSGTLFATRVTSCSPFYHYSPSLTTPFSRWALINRAFSLGGPSMTSQRSDILSQRISFPPGLPSRTPMRRPHCNSITILNQATGSLR